MINTHTERDIYIHILQSSVGTHLEGKQYDMPDLFGIKKQGVKVNKLLSGFFFTFVDPVMLFTIERLH